MPERRLRLILLAAVLGACGVEPTLEGAATWYGQVGPLVRAKCGGCHRPGGIAPFSLYEVDDARAQLERILPAIDSGLMPPFSAIDAPDCTPRHAWRDDVRLTPTERQLLHNWVDNGGDAGQARALPDSPSTSLDNPTLELAPAQAFNSSGDRDQFACFLLDPQLTSSTWLTGSQVYPTVPQIVHHANVGIVAPGDAAAAIAMVGGIGVPKLPCDTAPGVPYQSWLPGNPALVLPPSVAIELPAGALIAVQVHYHPAGVGGADTTSVKLRTTDNAPDWRYELGVYGNQTGAPKLLPDPDDPPSGPVFVIPANKPDHVETMQMTTPANLAREIRIMSVTPHMHMLGTHERATVMHAGGDTECLIDSSWSFDWQRSYPYAADLGDLPLFDPGSVITVSCHWDNTFDNPNLPRLLHDQNLVAPYDVQLGLTTSDEMCLADFGAISPR